MALLPELPFVSFRRKQQDWDYWRRLEPCEPPFRLDQPVHPSGECADCTVTLETAGDIHYDIWGGRDHYRPVPPVKVTFASTLWRVERQRNSQTRLEIAS
jgi:hypothetical protein